MNSIQVRSRARHRIRPRCGRCDNSIFFPLHDAAELCKSVTSRTKIQRIRRTKESTTSDLVAFADRRETEAKFVLLPRAFCLCLPPPRPPHFYHKDDFLRRHIATGITTVTGISLFQLGRRVSRRKSDISCRRHRCA